MHKNPDNYANLCINPTCNEYIFGVYSYCCGQMYLMLSNGEKIVRLPSVGMFLGLCLLAVNLLGFLLMGIDKYKARKRGFRIPEKTLFMTALIGGSIGSILGMYVFRHKTRHRSFTIGMPLILALQVIIVLFLYLGPLFNVVTI